MTKDLTPLAKELIGALIGLSKACYIHEKKESTDALIVRCLALTAQTDDTSTLYESLLKARHEKKLVAPGCSSCMSPCGNTNDYDMNEIQDAPEAIRETKEKILESLQELCVILSNTNLFTHDESVFAVIHRGLSVLSYDIPLDRLMMTLDAISETVSDIL